jgi:opacity protein-like surface antigen
MKSMIIGALTALFVASSSLAQAAITPEELEKRVRELEQKIAAMAEQKDSPELAEVRGQIEVLSKEIESLKLQQAKPAAEADTPQYGMGAAATKVYRAEQGLSFGGYGEMLYENYDKTADDGTASGRTDQLDFLRAILYAGYKFSDKVVFNSEIEFEHGTTSNSVGEVSVEFAYLDFMVRPEFNVRAGMVLLPVGFLNELHEPTAFLGAKRPTVEQRIIPTTWRENGAGFFGDAGDFTYRAYIVNGYDSAKFTASGVRDARQKGAKAKAEDFAIVGRLDWHPIEGVLLGASAYSGDSGQGRTVAGEEIGGNVTTTELHAEWKYRGLWLRGLWAGTSIDDAALINQANGLTGNKSIGEEQDGWYGEVGFDLTSIFPMGQSSLTPYYRYEEFNTQKDVPDGYAANPANDVEISTFGIAFKPIPQAVIKLDYQNIDDAANKGVDQVNAALGYIF